MSNFRAVFKKYNPNDEIEQTEVRGVRSIRAKIDQIRNEAKNCRAAINVEGDIFIRINDKADNIIYDIYIYKGYGGRPEGNRALLDYLIRGFKGGNAVATAAEATAAEATAADPAGAAGAAGGGRKIHKSQRKKSYKKRNKSKRKRKRNKSKKKKKKR